MRTIGLLCESVVTFDAMGRVLEVQMAGQAMVRVSNDTVTVIYDNDEIVNIGTDSERSASELGTYSGLPEQEAEKIWSLFSQPVSYGVSYMTIARLREVVQVLANRFQMIVINAYKQWWPIDEFLGRWDKFGPAAVLGRHASGG